MGKRCIFVVSLGCTLLLMGCIDNNMKSPDPLPVMTEHNKLTYSSKARSLITDFGTVLRKRFVEQHGDLSLENYQIPSEFPFDDIVDHFDAELEKTGNWTEVDATKLEWSTEIRVAGWWNEKNLFLVYALSPQGESDVVPLNTLSNTK